MDKHKRPYKCPIAKCNVKDFSNAGDLKRHQRAVHGRHTLFCPVLSCKRHTKGFGRKDNWMEHLKRIHALQSSDAAALPEDSRLQVYNSQETYDADSAMGTEDDDPIEEDVVSISTSYSEKVSLKAKLHELETLKANWMAKLDGDIAAVKRTLSLM